MKKFYAIIAGLLLLCTAASAQKVVSPELTDTEITFRLYAPYATQVKVNPSWAADPASRSVDMDKGLDGVWTITFPRPESEMYFYTFTVDGVKTLDPSNILVLRDVSNFMSAVIIPGGQGDLYKDIAPGGNLEEVWYYSAVNDMNRRMFVYTPYGYDRDDKSKKYPVLYLLHGGGGDESAWAELGRTRQLMDNLISRGLAKPMIVVMPNGNPNQYASPVAQIPVNANAKKYAKSFDNYESLTADIIPFIEKKYNVIKNRAGRAIAGLSMGGGQSFYEGFRHIDKFANIGIFSSGLIGGTSAGMSAFDAEKEMPGIFSAPEKYNRLDVLYFSCGETDPRITGIENFVSQLDAKGYKNMTYEHYKGAHEWHVWRESLTSFAQKLFK